MHHPGEIVTCTHTAADCMCWVLCAHSEYLAVFTWQVQIMVNPWKSCIGSTEPCSSNTGSAAWAINSSAATGAIITGWALRGCWLIINIHYSVHFIGQDGCHRQSHRWLEWLTGPDWLLSEVGAFSLKRTEMWSGKHWVLAEKEVVDNSWHH